MDKKIPKENDMRSLFGLALGAIAFAATILIITSAPGFLTDRDSTVPNPGFAREAGR